MTNNQRTMHRIYLMNEIQQLSNATAPEGSTDAEIHHFCMGVEAEIHYLKESLTLLDADIVSPEFLGNCA